VSEPDPPEDVPLPRGLRPSRVQLVLLLSAAGCCGLMCLWLALRPPEPSALALDLEPQRFEQETPEWLNDEARAGAKGRDGVGHERRHRVPLADDRLSNGLGVASAAPAAPAPREQAMSAGIIDVLKAEFGRHARAAPDMKDRALGADPMSALGALTGDQVGTNFGFGGTGLRGTGRGGGGSGEGTIGLGNIGTIGHGAGGGVAAEVEHDAPRAEPLDDALLQALTALRKRDTAHTPPRPAMTGKQLMALTQASLQDTSTRASGPADAFFARYASLEGLSPQPAHGYWQNTYVPGDAELRLLQARLASYDRDALLPGGHDDAPLDAGVSQSARPFDSPSQGALAAFVSASERGVTGPRRLTVQVGLQATGRFSGQRPALNLAIVLDLRDSVDGEVAGQLRSLLAAFVSARDVSDRFRLYAAGPGGGLVVAPDAFRSGPVTVGLQRLLDERSGPTSALTDVVDQALQELERADDPTAPLGSSGLVLISASAPEGDLNGLEARLHRGALAGVPASVFSMGARIGDEALTRLARAGQGSRRVIANSDDASRAVDQELSAVARVVARAVRLRMRLAPGVQLVSVLGARRLDELHAEQVRQAEQRIDQRVSRALGIAADRGEDEEGIQIVIPSFYAGDSHLVLLDVVVPGAGPVVDLSVRYKDLVQLDNAVLRESLALSNQELARGPLQQQVLESLLAHELASQLDLAGRRVAAGDASGAAQLLGELDALLDDARRQLPGLVADRQFQADRRLVQDYRRLLPELMAPRQREFLSDSMRFASLMKSQPRPRRDGTGVEP